jgi:cell envelope opacity-associated protein A
MQAADPAKALREMQAADPAKALRELQAADPAKAPREMQAADPANALWETTAALDPLKEFREMTGRLTRSAILDWTREVASAVSEPSDEILADFEATLDDGSPVEAEPVSQWLTQLPPLALTSEPHTA